MSDAVVLSEEFWPQNRLRICRSKFPTDGVYLPKITTGRATFKRKIVKI